MQAPEIDTFWDECPLIERVPGKVSGAPVLKDTRLTADTLVGNVEAFMELDGMNEEQAIDATLDCLPSTPGGKETIRKLLRYQEAHLHHLQP
jgi:uncharacterized protein (DUF433 family)